MILFLRVLRIAVFAVSAYLSARAALTFFKKRNSSAVITDPEVIVIGVFSGFVITTLTMLVVKEIIKI